MDDAKIVQLFFVRDEQAITETANKYGNSDLPQGKYKTIISNKLSCIERCRK